MNFSYFPNTAADQKDMLKTIGVDSVEKLLSDIPAELRLNRELNLPTALSEYELSSHMKALAAKNINTNSHICFLGGGIYDHYIPSIVNHLAGRQEFYTAYTPYQAEMSQGTLQAIFEFQTLMTMLTGMDVSNACVYDAASACAEAMLLAHGVNDKNEVIILQSVNTEYSKTCRTYANFSGIKIKEAAFDKSGTVDMAALAALIDQNTSSIIVQSPNFFGIIEDIQKISQLLEGKDILLIVAAAPVALGLLKAPGELGADIVVGEGQALGNPMNFGGPGFGFFTCKTAYMRRMPGRIVGETTDKDGNRGFVLTMQAREQHIRREKATSNICTNQALCALKATIYLTTLGKEGFKQVASLCFDKAHYMYQELIRSGAFEQVFDAPFFNEFVVRYKGDLCKLRAQMIEAGFLPGLDLSDMPGLKDCLLIAVTEKRTKEQIDSFVQLAKKAGASA